MIILPEELHSDRSAGLVVLAYAATVAPNIDDLDGLAREKAVAILSRVAADLPTAGSSRVSQQSRNGTSVSFRAVGDLFGVNDRAALRALCGLSSTAPAAPAGSFPDAGMVAALWPEVES